MLPFSSLKFFIYVMRIMEVMMKGPRSTLSFQSWPEVFLL